MSEQKNQKYGTKEFYEERIGEHFSRFHQHIDDSGFVLFFLAKKSAGKGTYSKILHNVTDGKVIHLSVGDLVRAAEKRALDPEQRQGFVDELREYYKGSDSIDDVVEKFVKEASDLSALLPTEMVMALIEKAVQDNQGKALIIDGFPRSLDQVNIAMKMQEDFEAKGLPSAFVEIDCPDDVLVQRQLHRVVCPECQTPRNVKVLLTEDIERDEDTGEYHLICDNKDCSRIRMKKKYANPTADDIEKIKSVQDQVKELIQHVREKAAHCHLVVSNQVLVKDADKHDPDDFTLEAEFDWDPESKQVIKNFKPWTVKDDEGNDAYSRWPDPVVADMIKVLTEWLDVKKKTK